MTINVVLALVHLGETNPKHLWANIKRIQRDFKELEITLIADSEPILTFAKQIGLNTYKYVETSEELDFFTSHNLIQDYRFRKGFWKYSLQRIFALAQFHASIGNVPIIHIENDIYIAPDFPFSKFSKFDKIAWCRYNSTHDAAAILFSPSPTETHNLNLWIKECKNVLEEFNDMTILNLVARNHNDVALLPIAESSYSELLNEDQIIEGDANEVTKYFDYFQGYFDPAGLGVWACGVDPRNNMGFVKRFKEFTSCYINASRANLKVTDGKLLDCNSNSVFNLHIHSKSLKILGVKNPNYLERMMKSKFNFNFSPRAFGAIVADYKDRGKILHLVYNLPPFTILRKFPIFLQLKDYFVRMIS